ncbi:MAG: response regulator [Leptolyngbya sp. Prado105]|jgi:diguanylate cyclase (GGDEF)-like protein|nr:response regulator [Leptolyngbya sp. Prado105]
MRVLLVEDDLQMSTLLKAVLTQKLYRVDVAFDGKAGWELAEAIEYDLILLDVMLPKLDGIQFCRRLRDRGCQTLVMMITARSTIADRVLGLNSGADDYVVKPFALPELEARIEALLRRKASTISSILRWGKLQIDPQTCEVTYDQTKLELTSKELLLLKQLIDGRVYSQSALVDQLWSLEEDPPREEAVRAHIKRLRQKLKSVEADDLIETVYGQGYRLNPLLKSAPVSLALEEKTVPTIAPFTPPRILLVTSDQEFGDRVIQEAATYPLEIISVTNTTIAQLHIRHQAPDLIVLSDEMSLPTASMRDIPVLLLANLHFDQTSLLPQRRGILYHPVTPAQILESCLDCLEPISSPIQRVMIIDDDQSILRLLRGILEEIGIQVNLLANPLRVWEELEWFAPDLLILDVQMPHIDGIHLCEAIRNDMRWAWLPILFLTNQQDLATIREIFAAGADDYITKPIEASDLTHRLSKRLTRMQQIRHQADFDALTNLPTHRRSRRMLKQLLHLAHQNHQSFCMAVLEIKELKQINQQYGYRYGNQVLQRVTNCLRQAFRNEDVIARWNGAEFIVGVHNLACREVIDWLAQILESLKHQELRSPMGTIQITFSAAVAQYPEDGSDIQALYQAAIARLKNLEHQDRIVSVSEQPSAIEVMLLHRNSEFAQEIMRSLMTRGYQSQWFQEGRAAWAALQAESPSKQRVLLLEAKLPGLNGISLLHRLKQEKRLQSTAVILLSTRPEEAEKAMDLGCFDYVTLPCPLPTLMQNLRKAFHLVSSKS